VTDDLFAPWRQPGYDEIEDARRVGDDLEVTFANGDVVRVAPERFGFFGDFKVEVVKQDGGAVRISLAGESREVSWEQLRLATDPDFAQEMRRQDAEEAKRLGLRLRALREDRNLSQRDLANMVGMPPPQLSKIESGGFDLRVSTVQTLLRAMGASFADVSGPDALEVSKKLLRRRSEQAGVPGDLVDGIFAAVPRTSVPRFFSRVFGWSVQALASGELQSPQRAVAVRFKTRRPSEPGHSPLVHAALVCSEIVRAKTNLPLYRGAGLSAAVAREGAGDPSGRVTLGSLVEWTWGQGVAVLPLHGRGGFSAASWAIGGAPTVVLKEPRQQAVFWLFDLAHEWGHIALGHVADEGVVDVESPQPTLGDKGPIDDQELEANGYALQLLFGDHGHLLSEVRRESRGNYLRFKGAVATVAKRFNLSPGLLGMVAAYELTEIGEYKDRWGSATNLAREDGDGRQTVEAALLARFDIQAGPAEDTAIVRTLAL
jgi:transcriptional regulator with XRE-family HTH domain